MDPRLDLTHHVTEEIAPRDAMKGFMKPGVVLLVVLDPFLGQEVFASRTIRPSRTERCRASLTGVTLVSSCVASVTS